VHTFSEISSASDTDITFPPELSFFTPYLSHYIREVLAVGGEAFVSRAPGERYSGVFIYDSSEKTGTIFTRSREVFDHFYGLKPFDSLFAELPTEHDSETYDIYTLDLKALSPPYSFSQEISVASESSITDIERFMTLAHPGINSGWVRVAYQDGDKCFFVRLGDEIAGVSWLSIVNGVGRFHSLYVKPQFRRLGIGQDLLYARILWLKSKHVASAFSEISRENPESSRIALKANMKVSGQMYQYFRKDATSYQPIQNTRLGSGGPAERACLKRTIHQSAAVSAIDLHNLLDHYLFYWRLLWC
jgi:ribosomal protein S18 acetylase RimI-like enzyme